MPPPSCARVGVSPVLVPGAGLATVAAGTALEAAALGAVATGALGATVGAGVAIGAGVAAGAIIGQWTADVTAVQSAFDAAESHWELPAYTGMPGASVSQHL